MKIDLHVHTTLSPCSSLTPEEILRHARRLGLDGVCVTDHNTMDIRNYMQEGLQPDGLYIVFGMEYDTPDGDFLVFGPFEDLQPGLCARELLQLVASAGGAAVAAHPFRKSRPVSEFVVREGLCGILETRNGRNTSKENRLSEGWLTRYALAACAGSDAHTLAELGCAATSFDDPVTSRADLIRVLNSSRASAQAASAA